MRKEPFFVGDIVHVFNRGTRKQDIVRDESDKVNFLLGLYYLNNDQSLPNPLLKARDFLKFRSNLNVLDNLSSLKNFKLEWSSEWGRRTPLVDILAFTLLDNHFHIVLQEIKEGGVSEFMRKISNSMTGYFNTKYEETGRLFQGPYKARRVDKDNYLQYLAVYIHIKNIFELYPGGLKNAHAHFDDAYEFALRYPYSSFGAYFSCDHLATPIITTDMFGETFKSEEDFKEFAKNCMDFVHFDERANLVHVDELGVSKK